MYKKIVSSNRCIYFKTGYLILLVCLGCYFSGSAQHNIDIPINNRVIINSKGYIIYAEITREKSKKKVEDELFYYWYSANDIKKTKGGYDGKLLHGKYTEFYQDKNLKTQGQFKRGVKIGKWKTWYENGQLREIQRWSKKGKRAKFEMFDERGDLTRTGKYRDERYHGIVTEITSGKISRRKYKDGNEIVKVKKVKSDSVSTKTTKKRKLFGLVGRRGKKDAIDESKETAKKNKVKKKNTISTDKDMKTQLQEPQPGDTGKRKKKKQKKSKTSSVSPAPGV